MGRVMQPASKNPKEALDCKKKEGEMGKKVGEDQFCNSTTDRVKKQNSASIDALK